MLEVIAIIVLVVYTYLGFKKPAIALLTSPFIALSIFIIAEAESAGAMVIAPFIFFGTVISVSISKRDPDSERWPQIYAKWSLIIFLCLLCTVTLVVAFESVGVFALIFFIIFISFGIAHNLTEQHATATYIVSTIGSSMRQNLPLPMALESAASGRSDKRQNRASDSC